VISIGGLFYSLAITFSFISRTVPMKLTYSSFSSTPLLSWSNWIHT